MSTGYASCSDKELLDALTIADDIRKEFLSSFNKNSNSDIKLKLPFESDIFIDNKEIVSTSGTDLTDDSMFLKSSSKTLMEMYKSFRLDNEFQAVSQDIQELYLMNDLFIEKKKALEIETNVFVKDAMLSAKEILSEIILNEKLDSINLVVKHILTIAGQVCRIRQVLQDKPWKSTLKVAPSCQEDVIKFFHTANSIMRKMLEDADSIENYEQNTVAKITPIDEKVLQSRLKSIIVGLARRIDILTEFRSNLSTSTDLESIIEFLNSDSVTSDHPKSTFLSNTTTVLQTSYDSGLNSLSGFE